MTKQFNVKDEIATEENLDLGPDGNHALTNYVEAIRDIYTSASIVAVESSALRDDVDYSVSGFLRSSPGNYFSFRSHQAKLVYSGSYTSSLLSILTTFPYVGAPDTEKLYISFKLSGDKFDLGSN